MLRILLFATLKERAQTARLDIPADLAPTVADLKNHLAERLPALAPHLPTVIVSVNHEFAFPDQTLKDGDEIALFPPVSGGTEPDPRTHTRLTPDPIDLNTLVADITYPTTGATCLFTGMVRAQTSRGEAHATARLHYEAYIPMAEAKMRQVAAEIRARWPTVEGISMVQRLGLLEPGTSTVLIACSAPHRDTGVFEAARYGIDRLKEIVPIWKKEIGPTGETWVEGHYQPQPGD